MVLLAAPAESLDLLSCCFLLCCLYCVRWCPLLCFLESPFGHWVFEPVFKTLLEMCPLAHNPFLAWSQSPNCSTSQADSSRPEASSASGVIPRRSPLMIWRCTLYPSGVLFFRGGRRVLRIAWWRVLASWFLLILDPPSPILLGRSGIWASILSILTHFPHRVSNRQPLTTQVVTINVHPPAWRFPWWLSQPFRQLRVPKKMSQLGLICPSPREDRKWQVFLWSAIVSISVVIATLPFWWVIVVGKSTERVHRQTNHLLRQLGNTGPWLSAWLSFCSKTSILSWSQACLNYHCRGWTKNVSRPTHSKGWNISAHIGSHLFFLQLSNVKQHEVPYCSHLLGIDKQNW